MIRPVNFPKHRWISTLSLYLLTLLLIGIITAGIYLLRDAINLSIIALLYVLTVGLSTALWGLGPGIVAALAAFLAFNYFFIQPYYSFMIHQTQDLLVLVVFLVIAVVISQLVGRTRQSLKQVTERELESTRLYEFSSRLAGLHNEIEIAQAICDQILENFEADRVEVVIEGTGGQQPIMVSRFGRFYSDSTGIHSNQLPNLIIPLQTALGLIGEIRLWRGEPKLQPKDEQLLRVYASQSVLAIERARLLQSETRTKVLEESDRLKTSLLSSVSHELRTPLATIKAAVSSLRSKTVEWDSEARTVLLEAVDEETDHLNQLVENLLNMSRIESGALQPNLEWNSLGEIVASVIKRFSQPAKRLSHTIVVELPEELPLVRVDYLQMEQVFTNLISNSMKYSPESSEIKIQAQPLREDAIRVQVSNQGPPVPEEHLERIFDKFHRITAADRVTGTGLGLSICKGIIEAHGGQIWAENLTDGFAFNFTLPLHWHGQEPHLPAEISSTDNHQ